MLRNKQFASLETTQNFILILLNSVRYESRRILKEETQDKFSVISPSSTLCIVPLLSIELVLI